MVFVMRIKSNKQDTIHAIAFLLVIFSTKIREKLAPYP